ncbi:hypothetical protein ACFLQI_00945, partial [Candidatus Undinarchaeota archaeon]
MNKVLDQQFKDAKVLADQAESEKEKKVLKLAERIIDSDKYSLIQEIVRKWKHHGFFFNRTKIEGLPDPDDKMDMKHFIYVHSVYTVIQGGANVFIGGALLVTIMTFGLGWPLLATYVAGTLAYGSIIKTPKMFAIGSIASLKINDLDKAN